jgi:hypothetical protein
MIRRFTTMLRAPAAQRFMMWWKWWACCLERHMMLWRARARVMVGKVHKASCMAQTDWM